MASLTCCDSSGSAVSGLAATFIGIVVPETAAAISTSWISSTSPNQLLTDGSADSYNAVTNCSM